MPPLTSPSIDAEKDTGKRAPPCGARSASVRADEPSGASAAGGGGEDGGGGSAARPGEDPMGAACGFGGGGGDEGAGASPAEVDAGVGAGP